MLFLSITRLERVQHFENKDLAIELRLDLFRRMDIERIKNFLQNSTRPVMLTVRKTSQGKEFQETESQREALIEQLLSLEPPFFDLEYDVRQSFFHEMQSRHPKTKFILSYHNFQQTPADLDKIYHSMRRYAAFSYKIAAMAHCTNDALKMLVFAKRHPKISAICMGAEGRFARVLGPIAGNLVHYASADGGEQTGPGQLSVSEWMDIYRYPSLNKRTAIYGLIGDPVENSPGYLYHNGIFRKRHLNAVYVGMNVKPQELSEFVHLALALGIQGLSVTMPLKEKILPFLDEIERAAKQIGAVNTLLFKNGKIIGTNTDGLGALNAIEKKIPVRGKTLVLLGAGGAARAIAFEAKARGANVLVLNRTVQRAKELAADLGCEAGGLNEMPDHYDLLINCSPGPVSIDPKKMKPHTLAMDIVYCPRKTPFLVQASFKKCQIIDGEEMFLNQAALQTAFWMGV